ncbi:HPP family protein [Massilia sp.]|uniref:HPP family protein n=1 Tax=Massilia sp. TaxID=1882437 RepID=UPI0028AFC481|nr:HPP family protein [Massilia sp.]
MSGADRLARAAAPPLAAALVLGLVGLGGILAGVPWLFPSLGPTVAIQASTPTQPSARPWNVCAGHLIGLACGIAAVHLTGAAALPGVTEAHILSGPRLAAAVLAVLSSMGLQAAAKARHPPAEATTLLFALGAMQPDLRNALTVAAGVVLVTVLGEGCRRMFARAAQDS